MTAANRQWVLSSRPRGPVTRENFEWREEPVPAIADGEFLVRNLGSRATPPSGRGWRWTPTSRSFRWVR